MNRTTIHSLAVVVVVGAFIFVLVCLNNMLTGHHSIEDALNQRPDTDETKSTNYHFAPFAGTTWRTRTKIAVAEVETYKGKQTLIMLPPQALDPSSPMYTSFKGGKLLSILPPGTKISIERLMEDHGAMPGVYVCSRVLGGTNNPALIQMGRYFFAANRYLHKAPSAKWDINPVLLERP